MQVEKNLNAFERSKIDDQIGIETNFGKSMSRIWLKGENMLVVVPPANYRTLELTQGTVVEVQVPTSEGLEAYSGEIAEVRAVPAVFIRDLTPVCRTQRRHSMRIAERLKVQVWTNPNDISEDKAVHCFSRNISASGILITVDKRIASQADDTVLMQIAIPGDGTITTRGQIKRFVLREEMGKSYYDLGIEFINMDLDDRELLVKYLLRKQFDKRK